MMIGTLYRPGRPTGFRRYLRHLLLLLCLGLSLALAASIPLDMHRMQVQMQARYGEDGLALLKAWQRQLDEVRQLPIEQQLTAINQFFNRHIRYSDDMPLWKTSDYWATPLELMGVRAGDCEDYTIAKYLSLLSLGVPVEQLRLIYVKAQVGGSHSRLFQAHMVLGYYPSADATPLILDNLLATIEPANRRPDLQPVFSFNSQGLWVGNRQTQTDPTARLSRWRDLLTRIQAEGFNLPSPAPSSAPDINQISAKGD
ncbi:conserved hypothetical protein [Cellvibrio japonicus Ueda107]|uniref:Transglutaminase n=1 Tax=Cellvibrio japonicus (strain Ueda107) TaxID=498211 RepID=B3PD34_CELJU|nr:conserved hypothetical protein [Cellvibrio japonicus Ueda107]